MFGLNGVCLKRIFILNSIHPERLVAGTTNLMRLIVINHFDNGIKVNYSANSTLLHIIFIEAIYSNYFLV